MRHQKFLYNFTHTYSICTQDRENQEKLCSYIKKKAKSLNLDDDVVQETVLLAYERGYFCSEMLREGLRRISKTREIPVSQLPGENSDYVDYFESVSVDFRILISHFSDDVEQVAQREKIYSIFLTQTRKCRTQFF